MTDLSPISARLVFQCREVAFAPPDLLHGVLLRPACAYHTVDEKHVVECKMVQRAPVIADPQ